MYLYVGLIFHQKMFKKIPLPSLIWQYFRQVCVWGPCRRAFWNFFSSNSNTLVDKRFQDLKHIFWFLHFQSLRQELYLHLPKKLQLNLLMHAFFKISLVFNVHRENCQRLLQLIHFQIKYHTWLITSTPVPAALNIFRLYGNQEIEPKKN